MNFDHFRKKKNVFAIPPYSLVSGPFGCVHITNASTRIFLWYNFLSQTLFIVRNCTDVISLNPFPWLSAWRYRRKLSVVSMLLALEGMKRRLGRSFTTDAGACGFSSTIFRDLQKGSDTASMAAFSCGLLQCRERWEWSVGKPLNCPWLLPSRYLWELSVD